MLHRAANNAATLAISNGRRVPIAGIFTKRHLLHEGDVVIFSDIAVLAKIRPFVWGHGGFELVDDLVRDEGMAEVELCDVRLWKSESAKSHRRGISGADVGKEQ